MVKFPVTMAVLLLGAWVLRASAAAVAIAGPVIALTGRFLRLDPVIALPNVVGVADPAAALCLKAVGALRGKAVDPTAVGIAAALIEQAIPSPAQ